MSKKTIERCAALLAAGTLGLATAAERRLPMDEFRDKMEGAWIGQSVGVAYGCPTEFKHNAELVPDKEMPTWKPEMVNNTYEQDDLYVEMSFISTLERRGLDVSCREAGIDFANSRYRLWCANANARDNIRNGIAAPASSHPRFHPTPDDIDYQIEADFSGILAPGLPQAAVDLGETFGCIMNYGDGLYAGQFAGALYAEAYFEADRVKVVEAALKAIPQESKYAQMVRDMLAWYKADAKDWKKAWKLAVDKYGRAGCATAGKVSWWGIDVKVNGAMVLLGFLWGEGDMEKTMRISTQGGYDSDCNPSSACGVLGAMLGAKKLGAKYTSALSRTNTWEYTTYDWSKLMTVCEGLVRDIVVKYGGKVEKDAAGAETLVICANEVKPSAFADSLKPGPVPEDVRLTDEEQELVLYRPCKGQGDPSEIGQAGLEVETAKWQRAIDEKSAQGGGRVVVPAGRHVVGQLMLKDNVELHFEDGAILEALVDAKAYAQVGDTPVEGGSGSGLIAAKFAKNVAVTGRGLIRGNKKVFPAGGMHGLYLYRCKGVRLEDFTLRDACSWGINFFCSEDVVVRRVKISNHAGECTDGIDIEAKNVLIEGCDVDAGDDAYCLKSNDARFTVENVLIRNCMARSHCNAFKLGTSTHGVMRNIRFEHCRSEASKRVNNDVGPMPKDLTAWKPIPGAEWYLCGPGFGCINVECVDGGRVENVVFDDIEANGFMMPIFVRGGDRGGRQEGCPHLEEYAMRDIVIQNVRGQAEASAPSTVTGTDRCRPKNVTLRNIDIACFGDSGNDPRKTSVPGEEISKAYPQPNMFDKYRLPAWGLFADKVDGLTVENVRFTLRPGTTDDRPMTCGL